MALTKKGAVDETLAIVKDIGKFKKRIEELAKAKSDADKSVTDAKTKRIELNKQMDANRATAVAAVRDIHANAKSAMETVKVNEEAVRTAEAGVTKKLSSVSKREEALRQDRGLLKFDREQLREDQKDFADRVVAFESAVKGLCGSA